MDLVSRLQRLGLKQRIMLYVVVGLAIMFGSFALLGLRATEQATELVYKERLSTASTTAGILERDFLHVARDVQEATLSLEESNEAPLGIATHTLLGHLSKTDPFPFFRVAGISVLNLDGKILAEAGTVPLNPDRDVAPIMSAVADMSKGGFAVLPVVQGGGNELPFVSLATLVVGSADSTSRVVAVRTVSVNSTAPYTPDFYRQTAPGNAVRSAQTDVDEAKYHLEVVSPSGIAILGIGEDERPGTMSRHFLVIQDLMAERKAAALVHKAHPGDNVPPHVMAVAPLGTAGFYVVLEQPLDVALALPMRVRRNLLLLAALGFLTTLLVAWITTTHIVRPVQLLTAAAQRMAQGDLESPVNVKAEDEVGRLAESLDSMRQQLSAAYQQLEHTNRKLEEQVKERTARLGEVLRKIISAQEEERSRLARELHDETAQALGALSISLDRARDSMNGGLPQTAEYLSEAKTIAARVLEETRRLILDLRPMALDDLGLAPAIRWYTETHLEERGVAVNLVMDQPTARLPKHIEVSLFRVVQEAVNNIAKHADARNVQLHIAFSDSQARIVVTDDGRGFDLERVLGPKASGKSVGLMGMQERVRLLNGEIQIRSQEGEGTEITVEIPITEESR